MTLDKEPRECPFCGAPAELHLSADAAAKGGVAAFVACTVCGVKGPRAYPVKGKTEAARRRAQRLWDVRECEMRHDVPEAPDSWEVLDMDLRDAARTWDELHPREGIAEHVSQLLDRMHALAGVGA